LDYDRAEEIQPTVRAEGIQTESDSIMWIARREFEDVGAPVPKVGDVIDFWDERPWGMDLRYWDVIKANPAGNIFNSEVFVQYKITLKRRTSFEAGRKVEGER
jgi:hypothetical protein